MPIQSTQVPRRTDTGGNRCDFSHLQNYRLWLVATHPEAAEKLFASTTILLTTNDQFARHQQYFAECWATR